MRRLAICRYEIILYVIIIGNNDDKCYDVAYYYAVAPSSFFIML